MSTETVALQEEIAHFEERQAEARQEWEMQQKAAGASAEHINELLEEVRQLKSNAQFEDRKWTKAMALQKKEYKQLEETHAAMKADHEVCSTQLEKLKLESRSKKGKESAMLEYIGTLETRLGDLTVKAGLPRESKANIHDLLVLTPDPEKEEIMVNQMLMAVSDKLRRIFYHYTKDDLTMSKTQWAKFAKDSNVISKHLTNAQVEIIYANAASSNSQQAREGATGKAGTKAADLQNDTDLTLTYNEFAEGVVRLAHGFYNDSDSVEAQTRDFLESNLPRGSGDI